MKGGRHRANVRVTGEDPEERRGERERDRVPDPSNVREARQSKSAEGSQERSGDAKA